MSVPRKPWAPGIAANRLSTLSALGLGSRHHSQSPALNVASNQLPSGYDSLPPPIPPRLDASSNSLIGYNRYGPGYRAYQRGIYSPMSPSLVGMGYNSHMMYGSDLYGPDRLQNSFIRFAEESSRPAFQSIESVVNGVNSISFMLESTFHAFQSSYQAVLGVADQFSRLRNHMTQMIATLAVLRNLRWLFRKILYHLGFSKGYPSEQAWNAASQAANGDISFPNGAYPSYNLWPLCVFLGIIMLGPWLISRLFSKAIKDIQATKVWASGKGDYMVGVAMYDFRAASPRELSFRAGQTLRIAPKNLQLQNKDWLLASVDGQNIGLVPANHIVIRHPAHSEAKQPAADLSSTKCTKSTKQSDRTDSDILNQKDSGSDNTCLP